MICVPIQLLPARRLPPCRQAAVAALDWFLAHAAASVSDPTLPGRVTRLEERITEIGAHDYRDSAVHAVRLRLRTFRAHWPEPPDRRSRASLAYLDDLGMMVRDDLPRLRKRLVDTTGRASARAS
jgi:hypothetical protein